MIECIVWVQTWTIGWRTGHVRRRLLGLAFSFFRAFVLTKTGPNLQAHDTIEAGKSRATQLEGTLKEQHEKHNQLQQRVRSSFSQFTRRTCHSAASGVIDGHKLGSRLYVARTECRETPLGSPWRTTMKKRAKESHFMCRSGKPQ